MGTQHNSHIANDTGEAIKIALTDTDNRNTTHIIQHGEFVCIPTPKGRNTLSVITKDSAGNKWNTKASASYTDNSDYSFIVEKVGGDVKISRTKYGTIWVKDSLQNTFKIPSKETMASSEQNIYMIEYDADGSRIFVDTEDIDDRHVENAITLIGVGVVAGGAQRFLEQRNYKYVFRKMGEGEFNKVRQQQALPTVEGPLNEKWITEEIGHPKQFQNKGVHGPERVAEIKVDRQQYQKAIKDHMIPQKGSRIQNIQIAAKGEKPFNVSNRELLKDYPARRQNVGLKGPDNIKAFNETIITVKEVDLDAFKNKNAFTRWASKNKLGLSLAAVALVLDAASITIAVQNDKGYWDKHTTIALSNISGGYAGGAIGAKICAALGSAFPIAGTAIGGFIGALLGGILGSLAAEGFAGIWVSLRRVTPGPGPPPLMWDLETHGPPSLEIACGVYGPPELDLDLSPKGAPKLDFELDNIYGPPL